VLITGERVSSAREDGQASIGRSAQGTLAWLRFEAKAQLNGSGTCRDVS